jgi:hypothetical protein
MRDQCSNMTRVVRVAYIACLPVAGCENGAAGDDATAAIPAESSGRTSGEVEDESTGEVETTCRADALC